MKFVRFNSLMYNLRLLFIIIKVNIILHESWLRLLFVITKKVGVVLRKKRRWPPQSGFWAVALRFFSCASFAFRFRVGGLVVLGRLDILEDPPAPARRAPYDDEERL